METLLPLITSEQAAREMGKSLDAFYKWVQRNPEKLSPAMSAGNSKLWNADEVKALASD